VLRACQSLLHLSRAERAALGFMHPGRVDVIGAGALVWHQVVRRLADAGVRRVVTSEHDILDGIALSAAD
jgi:exopolyphosphatase/guanosine-5'-triphosphate,3'-diphosphate pyrophosphatase